MRIHDIISYYISFFMVITSSKIEKLVEPTYLKERIYVQITFQKHEGETVDSGRGYFYFDPRPSFLHDDDCRLHL